MKIQHRLAKAVALPTSLSEPATPLDLDLVNDLLLRLALQCVVSEDAAEPWKVRRAAENVPGITGLKKSPTRPEPKQAPSKEPVEEEESPEEAALKDRLNVLGKKAVG